jgi:hypothetical protein
MFLDTNQIGQRTSSLYWKYYIILEVGFISLSSQIFNGLSAKTCVTYMLYIITNHCIAHKIHVIVQS